MAAVRLLDGVQLVGSGWLGFGLTDRYDSHVYALAVDGGSVVVDAGGGRGTAAIAANVRAAYDSAVAILLTHAHADHAAGAARLGRALGAPVLAGAATAAVVGAGDEERSGLAAARADGVYPRDFVYDPLPEVQPIEGPELRIGGATIEVLETPGHSDDHLSFVTSCASRVVAFAGDLVFARGRVVLLAQSDPDTLLASLRALAERAPDVLLPGHGEPILGDAAEHLEQAIADLEAGRPRSFLS
jgi:glyoxylase-like metal-dependent hydrolase (beta-lactamase superfamily II)